MLHKLVAYAVVPLDRQLNLLGITNLSSFRNDAVKEEVIANRMQLHPMSDTRPVALVCFPRHDWMIGSDMRRQEELCELINAGYRVVYCEVFQKADLLKMLAHFKGTRAISLLIIGGTGSSHRLAFSERIDSAGEHSLLITDEQRLKQRRFHSAMKKNSVVILQGCSLGKRTRRNTLADMCSRIFPMSKVFAPVSNIFTFEFVWKDNARVAGVIFNTKTARITPRNRHRLLEEIPPSAYLYPPMGPLRERRLDKQTLLQELHRELEA